MIRINVDNPSLSMATAIIECDHLGSSAMHSPPSDFYVVIVGSAWTLEDDVPTLELSTVDGTPFSQTGNQLYYKTRPALSISKVNEVRARHIFFMQEGNKDRFCNDRPVYLPEKEFESEKRNPLFEKSCTITYATNL